MKAFFESRIRAADSTAAFLINEKLASIMGKEDPVGERFSFMGIEKGRIVGVMKGFHFQSMREAIEPLAITVAYPHFLRYLMIRIWFKCIAGICYCTYHCGLPVSESFAGQPGRFTAI